MGFTCLRTQQICVNPRLGFYVECDVLPFATFLDLHYTSISTLAMPRGDTAKFRGENEETPRASLGMITFASVPWLPPSVVYRLECWTEIWETQV